MDQNELLRERFQAENRARRAQQRAELPPDPQLPPKPVEEVAFTRFVKHMAAFKLPSAKDESRDVKTETKEIQCVSCWDNKAICLMIPCSHLCLCVKCTRMLFSKEGKEPLCALCSDPVTSLITIFQ
jgi:hypothetical protein